jgi:SAM-dependent methyltransferase
VIIEAIPPGCDRALDVGCGTGALTRGLKRFVPQVTGIDRDGRSIELARAHPEADGIGYLLGDFLATPLPPASFGLVASVASLHHMDAEAALRAMTDLLHPGGVLAVVGLARGLTAADLALAIPAVIGTRARLAASAWQCRRAGAAGVAVYQPPIVWPPPLTYRDIRRLAARVLPGAHYHRHLYWRYSLVWTKPGEGPRVWRKPG